MKRELTCELRHIAAAKRVPLENFRFKAVGPDKYDPEAIVVYLLREILAVRHPTVFRYPADWWEALKDRWLPARWKRRWPVVFKEVHAERLLWDWPVPHHRHVTVGMADEHGLPAGKEAHA
ncbi:MAG TPA: hypothetical protein VM223_27080 [Planctomycetota bacterium]|nr:hypothetical protein [Planctomycetota bacterium]HUX00715.1 hypothetical protein [Phycisphaerae bacterium]